MPIYDWLDKRTGKQVGIIRSFDLSGDLPTREECPELTDEEYAAAEWDKQLGVGTRFMHGPNWSGRKGHW